MKKDCDISRWFGAAGCSGAILIFACLISAGCESTDYHAPHEAYDGGRGGEMHFPAGVSSSNNSTAGYAGNPPPLHPAPPMTPDVPPQ